MAGGRWIFCEKAGFKYFAFGIQNQAKSSLKFDFFALSKAFIKLNVFAENFFPQEFGEKEKVWNQILNDLR